MQNEELPISFYKFSSKNHVYAVYLKDRVKVVRFVGPFRFPISLFKKESIDEYVQISPCSLTQARYAALEIKFRLGQEENLAEICKDGWEHIPTRCYGDGLFLRLRDSYLKDHKFKKALSAKRL